jgi:glycosyltransferase involved in cell wall biosynthesis
MRGQRSGLVTIVLPTYNRATRLEKAIESCLKQTYRSIELIVVDDGSTDHTSQIVAACMARDLRVRVVHQANAGLPRALNAGFGLSRGEFLTWTSDDNEYAINAIEVMVRALEDRADVDLVYCDYELVDETRGIIGRTNLPEPEALLKGVNCVGACFLYRRSVYEQLGDYDPNVALAEDYDYWLRVHAAFRMAHLPGACPYRYGVHPHSLTATRAVQAIEAFWRARLKNARGPSAKAHLYLNWGSEMAVRYLHVGAPERALGPALRCWCVAPWGRTRRRVLAECVGSTVRAFLRQGLRMGRRPRAGSEPHATDRGRTDAISSSE